MKRDITIESLTNNSVNLKEITGIDENGNNTIHRISYSNNRAEREQMKVEQPDNVVNAVLAMWGDIPTIEDEIITDSNKS